MKLMFFSNTHWSQLMAPFCSILFETSICQFNSSTFSPIMPYEVREHLTRDQRPFRHPESLQTRQFHSSVTVLLLFSSPLSFFSTWFRSEDWNGHSRRLVLCPVTHFCVVFEVYVWIIVQLEDPNMAYYKIQSQSLVDFFYLLVFDRIHDAMCLNKISRTFSRNIGPRHQKCSSIFHGLLFIPVFTKPILSVCC